MLIVFSSPHCAPCDQLAPKLEKFYRNQSELELIMISNGEPKENRAKVKEHGLTFAVVLQPGWSISRRYAIFATPAAYLIDQQGVICRDVAVGARSVPRRVATPELPADRHARAALAGHDQGRGLTPFNVGAFLSCRSIAISRSGYGT